MRRRPPLDVARLREAISGPGADTRRWVDHVLLTSEAVLEAGGVYADGETQPGGERITVRLAPVYVGAGGAVYVPARKGDLVVVAYPGGNLAGGAVEIARLFADADPVPGEVRAKPLDLWIVASEGQDVRIKAAGGTVSIQADLIKLETTGVAATSRIFLDGVNWAAQWSTPSGPTVGPPVSSPTNPNAGALAAWEAAEASEG